MICPECGSVNTVKEYRDMPYTYKGQTIIVKAVGADWCLNCGEGVVFTEESIRIDSIMGDFNKQVNASIIEPEFVIAMRKSLICLKVRPVRSLAVGSTPSHAMRQARLFPMFPPSNC